MRGRLLGGLVALSALAGAHAATAQVPQEVQYRPANPRVLVAGDSLEVGTAPHLRETLAGVPVTVDAVGGRPSPDGIGVLSQLLLPGHRVVVFDLGTNDDPGDPGRLAASLSAARRLAGERCMVVATLTKPPLNGVSVDGLNGVITDFAAVDPATELVDWHAVTESDPSILTDGIHATPDGYAARASLIAEGVSACLAGSGGGTGERPPPPPRPPRPAPRPAQPPRVFFALASIGALLDSVPRVLDAATSEARDAVSPETPEPVLGGG